MQTKNFFKKTYLFLLFLCLTLSACKNSTEEDSKKIAEEANKAKFDEKEEKKDAQYLVDLYSAGMFEVKVAEEAKNRAVMSGTKNAANMIDTSHQRINNSIKLLATSKQVTLPTELTDKQKEKLQDLIRKKGVDFDKSFIDAMIAGHKDAISSYEEASAKCTDIDIKNWATNTLPEIRKHLDMVTNLKEKTKN